ncbi:MAG: Hpt domain-containing protein [Clostridia bacterium]
MSELLNRLDAYGVNIPETMDRFVNDTELYERCLQLLLQDENWGKLGEALQAADLEQAFMAAHTLKGVTGNMGLQRLYDRVCEIVEPLRMHRTDVEYAQAYRTLMQELEQVKKLLAD